MDNSRGSNALARIFNNLSDSAAFKTIFITEDGLPLFKIVRTRDGLGNIKFEFVVDGAENPYATEDYVNNAISELGTVLEFKGTVATVDLLPTTGNEPGYVYYVSGVSQEYVWIVDDGVGHWEELGPIVIQDIHKSYTIASSAWTALSSSYPYDYQATIEVSDYEISQNTEIELVNNQAVLFANYGFAIGSVSGQNITIYSIGAPSANVTLEVIYRG